MKSWQKQIESAAFDLTHMEINTIVCSEMTAAKTPTRPREMLHSIAIKYDNKLNSLINEYNLVESLTDSGEFEKVRNELYGIVKQSGFFSYEELMNRTHLIEQEMRKTQGFIDKSAAEIDADLAMVYRIRRNAQEIMDVLYQSDPHLTYNASAATFDYKYKKRQKTYWYQSKRKKEEQTFKLIPASISVEKEKVVQSKQVDQSENPVLAQSYFDQVMELLKSRSAPGEQSTVTLGDLRYSLSKSRGYEESNTRDDQELPLDLRQLAILKKAFDIGTSKVALQTIIGLDGDVTTRIAKAFADNQNQLVNELHHDGIRLSVGYWKTLINAITEFGKQVLQTFNK